LLDFIGLAPVFDRLTVRTMTQNVTSHRGHLEQDRFVIHCDFEIFVAPPISAEGNPAPSRAAQDSTALMMMMPPSAPGGDRISEALRRK
jgi:hypothetical protein